MLSGQQETDTTVEYIFPPDDGAVGELSASLSCMWTLWVGAALTGHVCGHRMETAPPILGDGIALWGGIHSAIRETLCPLT